MARQYLEGFEKKSKSTSPYSVDNTSSVQGTSETGTGSDSSDNGYLDEIQELIHNKNYSALTDKLIANYNLKQQTQKYLNNSLQQSGLGNSGYSASAQAGVQNNYSNLYGQDLQSYYDSENTAAQDAATRAETASTDNDNQLITYLTNSGGTTDELDKYMSNYGYGLDSNNVWRKLDSDGNPTGDKASAYILSAYQLANSSNGSSGSSTKFTVDQLRNLTVSGDYGSKKYSESFDYETQALSNMINKGSMAAGTVVKMTNGSGETMYVKYNGSGTCSIVSEKDYNSAASKAYNKAGKWQTIS